MSVIKVSCKYFTTVLSATKKDGEIVEFQAGKTVQEFLDFMSAKYGDRLFTEYLCGRNDAGREIPHAQYLFE